MEERFELPAELTIYHALETRDAMHAWFSTQSPRGPGALVVSGRHVAEVDGAGLQLLAALTNTGQPWQLVEPSEALRQACKTLGIAHSLGPQVARVLNAEAA